MIKKIKIRDMTEEQRDKICKSHNLTQHGWAYCGQCPFCAKALDGEHCCLKRIAVSFLSNDFLNKEVEVEVPDILTKEEKEWLKATIKLLPFKTGKIRHCKFREGEFIIMFTTEAEDNYADLSIKYDLFQKMEINQYYTLEELGL